MVTKVRFGSGITGYLARPQAPGKRPVVMNLHERYGIDKHTTDLAQKIADAGYVGFAPDLYWRFDGDREALARGDVRLGIRDDEAISDLDAAIAYLRTLDYVDGDRIGIVGVCASGRHPLLMAAHGTDLSCAVVFYGAIGGAAWEANEAHPEPLTALIDRVQCPVLGAFGEKDHGISIDDVVRFRNYLESRNKSFRIRLYRDAPHGWLNDTMPGRYREAAAKDAWQFLLTFLEETFGEGWDRSRILQSYESDVSPSYDFSKNVRLA